MADFCSLIMVGRVTKDPELRYTPKGTPVATFSLAINRRWKNDTGEEKEEVTFVECATFGKSAETFSKHVSKAKCLLIEGRLRQEHWEDKTTQAKRSKLMCVVESWQFSEPKPANGKSGETGDPFA